MTQLQILEIPHPVLRQKATAVPCVNADITQTLTDMMETMHANNGVGLAGNQVGLLKRLIVVDISSSENDFTPLKMVNPKIIEASDDWVYSAEGCLSIPKEYADVDRHTWVRVTYTDENAQEQEILADGLLAIVLQHEIDHLDGVLFVDRLSPLKRKRLLTHLEKRRKKELQETET